MSLKAEKGNMAFLTIAMIILVCFIFAAVFDICQLYVAREQAKNFSDSIALALAQDLIFFDSDMFEDTIKSLSGANDCKIVECTITYDGILVTAEKKVGMVFLDRIIHSLKMVRSRSLAGVTFPWDESLGLCDSYRFHYRD
ncbi:MAG: flp pilus-assembly TadE/G-like family protein [Actinobacteria bacterium]|nr:flp pilus-assembly TadE/G-like family protein [Actinomycetota bacterium]